MTNIIKRLLLFTLIIMMFTFLLTDSEECIILASRGLLIWFERMIPTLFPFMVLSGFLVKTGFAQIFGKVSGTLLHPIFPLSSSILYAIFMGFTCGFPMGAKVIRDLINEKEITKQEGEYLLTFINNIGILYLLGYVSPLLGWQQPFKYLVIFYLVPLLYGFFLLHLTFYRNLLPNLLISRRKNNKKINIDSNPDIESISNIYRSSSSIVTSSRNYTIGFYIKSLFYSIRNSLEQITLLGGCMIIFNCLQIFPVKLNDFFTVCISKTDIITLLSGVLCTLTEIGGGLSKLSTLDSSISLTPLTLSLLTFGGLCCIFQTYTILEDTGLSIKKYILHKIIQSLLMFFIASVTYSK